jgi:hypothetical protein
MVLALGEVTIDQPGPVGACGRRGLSALVGLARWSRPCAIAAMLKVASKMPVAQRTKPDTEAGWKRPDGAEDFLFVGILFENACSRKTL